MNLVEKNISKLSEICKQHNVKELYIFGSVLSKNFNEKSDIDFLIQFGSIELQDYFDNYMDLKEKLEFLFKREIDLVENQAVRNPVFRKIINRDKKLIYERKSA